MISSLAPRPDVVFNAVGTTRAAAGGLQNQWKIDYDLCKENAIAAKEAGVKTYVFISSAGTRGLLSSYVPYSKMKIGVEDAIKELDFEHAIVLRPGMILGREKPKAPFLETIFANLNRLGQGVQDKLGMTILIYVCILWRYWVTTHNVQVRIKPLLGEQPLQLLVLPKKERRRRSIGLWNRLIFSSLVETSGRSEMLLRSRCCCYASRLLSRLPAAMTCVIRQITKG